MDLYSDGIKDSLRDQGAAMDREFGRLQNDIDEVKAGLTKVKAGLTEVQATSEKSLRELQTTLEKSIRDAQTASEKSVREVNASVKDIKVSLMWLGVGGGGLFAVLQFVLGNKSEVAGFLKSLQGRAGAGFR